jgi:hypothetical protein
MKKIILIATAFAVCFLFAPLVSAQSVINGYASCSYDYDTHLVTGVVTTELDYSSQDWYQAMVNGSLYTDENVILASGQLKDLDRDGTVSKTMQATDNSSLGYTAKGTNLAIADIQDPALGINYYVDYWNYQAVLDREGMYHYIYMPYYGYGPRKRTNIRNITLGATMAQAKVVGFQKAKLCSGSYDYDNTFKATVTLDVTTSGCSTEAEDPCATDPDAKFDVTIDFTLPKDATGVSGSNMADPGRTIVKPQGSVPSDNEYYILNWKYQNVDVTSSPKKGQMVLTLHRRGRGEDITADKIEIQVAGNYGTGTFVTPSSLKVACP